MDPGLIPPQLPELTMAEEMLIARAHVQMDISRVRGCQYKYKGHDQLDAEHSQEGPATSLPPIRTPGLDGQAYVDKSTQQRGQPSNSAQISCSSRPRPGLASLSDRQSSRLPDSYNRSYAAQLSKDGSIIDDVPTVLDDDEDENNDSKEAQGQPTESEEPSGGIFHSWMQRN